MRSLGNTSFASLDVVIMAVIFYFFTCFTIDTSLLWALVAH